MKLIDKQARCNSETYTPELLVTVSIPWELMNDDAKPGEDAMAYEIIGEKFINILKSLTKQSAADRIFMNERIKELAEQAVIAVDNPFPGNPLNDELEKMYIPDCFAEKFAELIVKDCLQMADEFEIDVNRSGLVDRMKYHFGLDNK